MIRRTLPLALACLVSLSGTIAQAQLAMGPADSASKVGSLIVDPNRQGGRLGVVGIGSCFFVDQRGYVATSFSNVEKVTDAAVTFNANNRISYPVVGVVAASRGKDIAILALRGLPPHAVPLKLNAAADPELGHGLMRWGGPLAEKAVDPNRSGIPPLLLPADLGPLLPKIMRKLSGDEYELGSPVAAGGASRAGRDLDTKWIWLEQPCQRSCIGGPAFDQDGDVVGMVSGAFDSRPEISAVIHIKHVVDLIPVGPGPVKVRPLSELKSWDDPLPIAAAMPLRDPATKVLGGRLERGRELADRFRDFQRRLSQVEQEEAEVVRTHAAAQAKQFELVARIDAVEKAIAAQVPEEAYSYTVVSTRYVSRPGKSKDKDKGGRSSKDDDDDKVAVKYLQTVSGIRHSARQLAILGPLRIELPEKQAERDANVVPLRFLSEDQLPFVKRLRERISEEIFYLADPLALRSRAEHETFEKLLTEIIDDGGAPAMLYLLRAMTRVNLRRLDAARSDLTEAIDADAKMTALAQAVETRCKIQAGQAADGLAELKRAISQAKNDPRVLMLAARTALDRGDADGATRYLLSAAPSCPDQAELRLGLSWINATTPSNLNQSLAHATEAVRLSGGHDWSSLAALAAVHVRAKDFTQATAEADAAVRLAPETAAEQCSAWQESVANKQIPKREWKP